MGTLERDGREVHFRVADRGGSGPTCVFVHGSGADRRVWKAQDRLASDLTVVAVDLAGHGRSDDIDAEPGSDVLEVLAADVGAVAERTGAEVLVGNSLGGAVVQWGLLEGHVDPEAAMLVGTGAKLAVREDLRDWLADDFERAIDFLHGPNRLFADPSPAMIEASKASMRECGWSVTERDFLTCHTFDVRDRVGEIDVPTLAVCGALDELTPPSYHEYLVDRLPNARLRVVPDAAHLVMIEQPGRFNRALADSVSRIV